MRSLSSIFQSVINILLNENLFFSVLSLKIRKTKPRHSLSPYLARSIFNQNPTSYPTQQSSNSTHIQFERKASLHSNINHLWNPNSPLINTLTPNNSRFNLRPQNLKKIKRQIHNMKMFKTEYWKNDYNRGYISFKLEILSKRVTLLKESSN